MKRILIVEDEEIIRQALKKVLQRQQFDVAEADSVEAALALQPQQFDLVISDLRLPGALGTDLLQRCGDTPVIIMTSYASMRSAIDAMKLGAVDYIAKPFDNDEMLATVQRVLGAGAALSRKRTQKKSSKSDSTDALSHIIGNSPAMQALYSKIHKVAPTDATVLICGETGTGKELIANAIHNSSPRAQQPMISVNCAAIPETLIEAELFGHEKGAFTGATQAREGLITAADDGTLFLDEIGELPLEAQARLLRVLQESEVRAIGSVSSRKVNIRLVAATHRDLRKMCDEKTFREDLYFRINVVQLNLPALRERGDDILLIATQLLTRYCEKIGRAALSLSTTAQQAIAEYPWPGNVRELDNIIQRAVILCDANARELDSTQLDLPATNTKTAVTSLEDYFVRFVLDNQDALSETEIAQRLGISRKNLWERRQKMGIPRPRGGKQPA
ncbi:MAG TPA: sigma-54 dependent transcriptional regulator [Pseudomonadales bacterium]|jgi:DNA-binding NtrC family response regulator|nr:sigma-54 dependent transcriptional regulator [Pseudomonadales bacterium]HNL91604.1 sigma-54 dependent transcriptional regulator [Pseudomonadales bacterium]HNN86870.1 sigma-54 dependent transcriptional regulator [Pseudomonadales bacterium]